jgi:hypothetical protein
MRLRLAPLPGAILCLASLPTRADVVWPALFLETRLITWWTIGLGLLVEFFFVRGLFSLTVKKAAIATVAANAVSAVLGLPLIPIAGIAWEFFPGQLYMRAMNWGTFNPITWAATFALACFITTVIEALVYRHAFKFSVHRREFSWLLLANALSVGVAFASLFIVPVQS